MDEPVKMPAETFLCVLKKGKEFKRVWLPAATAVVRKTVKLDNVDGWVVIQRYTAASHA